MSKRPAPKAPMKKSPIADLLEALKDPGYRIGWVANIAMAYKDNERWYRDKTGKRYLNSRDRYNIANKAAEYFLELLLKSPTPEAKKGKAK